MPASTAQEAAAFFSSALLAAVASAASSSCAYASRRRVRRSRSSQGCPRPARRGGHAAGALNARRSVSRARSTPSARRSSRMGGRRAGSAANSACVSSMMPASPSTVVVLARRDHVLARVRELQRAGGPSVHAGAGPQHGQEDHGRRDDEESGDDRMEHREDRGTRSPSFPEPGLKIRSTHGVSSRPRGAGPTASRRTSGRRTRSRPSRSCRLPSGRRLVGLQPRGVAGGRYRSRRGPGPLNIRAPAPEAPSTLRSAEHTRRSGHGVDRVPEADVLHRPVDEVRLVTGALDPGRHGRVARGLRVRDVLAVPIP